jgi:hypothetical protein
MELSHFTHAISRLTGDEIRVIATGLQTAHSSAADEVTWWQATIAIDRVLRSNGRTRTAAMAAMGATKAVQTAATADGIELPDGNVTSVARAAAEIARAIVAGPDADGPLVQLTVPWTPVLRSVFAAA